MAGIAGAIDLLANRTLPAGILRRMADAMPHRGGEEAVFQRPGLGLVSRRLTLLGGEHGRQPATNDKGDLKIVFGGELFDYPELAADLNRRGRHVSGTSDTELLPHLWEEHGTGVFPQLRGQWAMAVWNERERRLVLARDRFGICPLHWTRQDGWLLFASEIKTLLASGLVPARVDRRGIAQLFTFFGLPGPVTCFEGVSSLLPGHYLDIELQRGSGEAKVCDETYWEMDFPAWGEEQNDGDQTRLVEEYEAIMLRALRRRLRADVPVVAYASGGLDSSMLISMARQIRGEPLDTFTFAIQHPTLKESAGADLLGEHLGKKSTIVECAPADIIGAFPRLVYAAESPVIDASAAALFMLAEAVHKHGYGAVLTGEGADEWQAGYPWFRIKKKVDYFDLLGLPVGQWGYWAYACWVGAQHYPWAMIRRAKKAAGGHNAWLLAYHLMSTGKQRFFSPEMYEAVGEYLPFDDLGIDSQRVRRWHPLSRSLYMGARIHLAGLHLNARGDRSSMHASVENRYPFLDEDLFDFLARLGPRWKLRGLEDKYLQRRLAERWLPPALTQNRKALLHAPLQAFFEASPPPLIEELLSETALRRTGYFDPKAVQAWRKRSHALPHGHRRLFVEMGLVGVISTQLWHHFYIDGNTPQ